ncbi:hypothetical protein CLOM_g11411 [Closterium sp. NIES-68]|nr:hypothetical protein CLOM_g11411 [Closterium sp. NIES-68]GJP71715.1 hypothetical protein CLOP_g2518 [Closterium sp. NIES-67]
MAQPARAAQPNTPSFLPQIRRVRARIMRSTPPRFVALAILLAVSLLITGEFQMQRGFESLGGVESHGSSEPQRQGRSQRFLALIGHLHRKHPATESTIQINPHQGDESEQEEEEHSPAVAAPPLSADDFKTLESLLEQPVEEEDGQENEEEGGRGGEEEEEEAEEVGREKGKVSWGLVGRLAGFGSQLASATWERMGGVVKKGLEVWERREKEARSRKKWRRVVERDRRERMVERRRGGKGRRRKRKASVVEVSGRLDMMRNASDTHTSSSSHSGYDSSNSISGSVTPTTVAALTSSRSSSSKEGGSRRAGLLEQGPAGAAGATALSNASAAAAAAAAAASSKAASAASSSSASDCPYELDHVLEVEGLREDALLPRNFSVRLLTLDPSRRRTGLPLKLEEWSADSVFVIGTGEPGKGRRETLLALDKRFHGAGLKYTQVVMPMQLEEPFKARYDPVFPARVPALRSTFRPHALAYAFAHFEVWARVVVLRLPFALVFEDDARNEVESNTAWKHRMEGVLRQLNLLIIQNGNRFFFDALLLARSALAPYSEQPLTTNIFKAQPSMGSHAYLITYAGAKKMLSQMRLTVPISEALFTVPHANILAADPPLFAAHMFMCRPKPCRAPPLDLYSSSRLSSSCRSTLFLSFPGHPRIRGNIVRKDWVRQASVEARAAATIAVDADCGTPAQCLIRSYQEILLVPGSGSQVIPQVNSQVPGLKPPAGVRVLMRSMPPKLSMWPTFVIGLAEDADRFDSLEPVLQQQGFGEIIKANGIAISNTDYQVVSHLVDKEHRARTRTTPWWQEKQARPTLSKGEVGCALSHYFVWLEVVRRQLPYAIVFEDDVRFRTRSFREVFERNVAEANEVITREINPFRPDIVFLGKSGIMTTFYYPKLSPHVVISPLVWCSFAYIVSLEGAEKLVERFFVNDPVDSYWWQVPDMQFWAFEPMMADHLTVKRKGRGRGVQFESRVQGTDSEW